MAVAKVSVEEFLELKKTEAIAAREPRPSTGTSDLEVLLDKIAKHAKTEPEPVEAVIARHAEMVAAFRGLLAEGVTELDEEQADAHWREAGWRTIVYCGTPLVMLEQALAKGSK